MTLASALRFGVALPVRYAWNVLPFYLLTTGAAVAGRVPFLAALGVVVGLLRVDGRLEALVRAADSIEPDQLDPASPQSLPPELTDALANLASPTVFAILGLGVLASVVLFVVLQSVTTAATLSALHAAFDGRAPLTEGVAGMSRWRTFLGLTLLRAGVFLVGGGLLALGVGLGAAAGGVAGILVGVVVGGLAFVFLLVVWLGLSFVGPAVVVDDVGVLGSVRASLGFIRRNPLDFLGYVVVSLGVGLAFATAAGLANVVGTPQLVAAGTPLVVGPVLGGFQMALYAGERGDTAVDAATDGETAREEWEDPTGATGADSRPSVRERVGVGLGRGWRALGAFVVGHPTANLLSAVLLAGSVAVGWFLTAPYGVAFDPPGDVAGVFGTIAVGPFLNIAANNWLVAAGGSYGGLALGVPTVASVVFNGVLIGALAGLFDRLAFLALVAPHGVIELPALAVAGGLGLHLGRVGFDGLRGRLSAADVGDELGRAFEVLVGLAVVFVVASFIEAFLTPRIAAFVLGG
ncbi:Stage II sporulation protein M [Halogranum gelatinilyticum]|uniref:Stage II sporulation protein M n=1 Tax=Halogranum gelatinilyticum TaxID=660521 RepID=A0A1G9NYD4_9EURY|nr:stage II sporulation protein M [Halogranum gelatinilyticum]SDL91037.1 Stage II sporulation protein M [Halogranum gelatinilyticum]